MESPHEKVSLTSIAKRGESYSIAERVELEHMVGRGQIGKLILDIGDVIVVKSNDPRHGLSFSTTKYPEGDVIVSPRQAASISVECI